jgi:hypothetical protein
LSVSYRGLAMRVSQLALEGLDDLAHELRQIEAHEKRDELLASVEALCREIQNLWAEAELRAEERKRLK